MNFNPSRATFLPDTFTVVANGMSGGVTGQKIVSDSGRIVL